MFRRKGSVAVVVNGKESPMGIDIVNSDSDVRHFLSDFKFDSKTVEHYMQKLSRGETIEFNA
jgi:ATPase subunit of ABC transporter with duplicated ATPase domains